MSSDNSNNCIYIIIIHTTTHHQFHRILVTKLKVNTLNDHKPHSSTRTFILYTKTVGIIFVEKHNQPDRWSLRSIVGITHILEGAKRKNHTFKPPQSRFGGSSKHSRHSSYRQMIYDIGNHNKFQKKESRETIDRLHEKPANYRGTGSHSPFCSLTKQHSVQSVGIGHRAQKITNLLSFKFSLAFLVRNIFCFEIYFCFLFHFISFHRR